MKRAHKQGTQYILKFSFRNLQKMLIVEAAEN